MSDTWGILVGVLAVLIWLKLLWLWALDDSVLVLAETQLKPRPKAGDMAILRRQLPFLAASVRLLSDLLICLLGLITFAFEGLGWGFVLLLVALGLAELGSRLGVVSRFSLRLFWRYHKPLFRLMDSCRVLLRPFARDLQAHGPMFYSKAELASLISADRTILSPSEKQLLTSALEYEDHLLADIMTPRPKIEAVHSDEALGPILLDRLHAIGHRHVPVIEKNIDQVVGVLSLDRATTARNAEHVSEVMEGAYYLRADWTLDHALAACLRTEATLFIVMNEKGKTLGLVTLSDIVHAILGRSITSSFNRYDDKALIAKIE